MLGLMARRCCGEGAAGLCDGEAGGRRPGSSCDTAGIAARRWIWPGPGCYLGRISPGVRAPMIARQAQVIIVACLTKYCECSPKPRGSHGQPFRPFPPL